MVPPFPGLVHSGSIQPAVNGGKACQAGVIWIRVI